MRHTRAGVTERTISEFELLDALLAGLTWADWARPLARSETDDPWTVKDAVAHIVHWRADTARRARHGPRPVEERGLDTAAGNHLVYLRWRDRSPQAVLDWHRAVQADVLEALRAAPDAWFSGREHAAEWPYDLVGHSTSHRLRDIGRTLRG
ncbi:MAG TPA: maleylpyruvate isomerase N-terminal domain-containing protein [Candidatus Sulfotelmatobacter sp.]|jgi:hypothetical protein|nr:maleylpyruvate isomerase N-terminal domain-containing protein [Candidatus Sulfotelmatobacter sp.]